MIKTLEGVDDVDNHGEVHLQLLVIPFKVHPKVEFSFPFALNLAAFDQDGHEVIGMLFANIFYTKVIHTQNNAHQEPLVHPEPECDLDLFVSLFVQPLF